jgi:hypothetical protein
MNNNYKKIRQDYVNRKSSIVGPAIPLSFSNLAVLYSCIF